MEHNQKHQEQLDDFNLNNSSQDLTKSGHKREELVEESRRIFDDYYNKIMFYSAGAFSFSLALISLVVKDKTQALAHIGFIFANVYWLYSSLFLYLVVCALVLLSKRFDAYYLGSFGANYYAESLSKYEKANIDWLMSHANVLVKNSDSIQEINTAKVNLSRSEKAEKEMKKQFEMYYRLKRLCHYGSELFVSMATILLFIFFVQLIQETVWG